MTKTVKLATAIRTRNNLTFSEKQFTSVVCSLSTLINDFKLGLSSIPDCDALIDRVANSSFLNLSSVSLSNSAKQLLSRGLQFSPTVFSSDEQVHSAVSQACDDLIKGLHRRFWVLENEYRINYVPTSDATDILTHFNEEFIRHNSRWEEKSKLECCGPHSLMLKHLHSLLNGASHQLRKVWTSNISYEERSALSELIKLAKNSQITIRKADKGRCIVVMDHTRYVQAVEKFLSDETAYRVTPFNSKYRCAAQIRRVVRSFADVLGPKLTSRLVNSTLNPSSRYFYALPKIHKPRSKWDCGFPPLRPICPDTGTETSLSAKYIAAVLTPLFKGLRTYVKNSEEVACKLSAFTNLPESAVFLCADIEQLYPKIPVGEALEAVTDFLELHTPDQPLPQRHLKFVVNLLRVELSNNAFEFNGRSFEQLQGIPMGRAWAPAVASIFLDKWDHMLLRGCTTKPLAFWRYIDDVLLIFDTKADAEQALSVMQGLHPSIRVSDIQISKSIHFLDLNLNIVSNRARDSIWHRFKSIPKTTWHPNLHHVECTLYRKPHDTLALLDFHSAHPYSVKYGVLFSQCLRIVRLSNNFFQAGLDVGTLLCVMKYTRNLTQRTRWKVLRNIVVSIATHFLSVWSQSSSLHDEHTNNAKKKFVTCLRIPLSVVDTQFRDALKLVSSTVNERDNRVLNSVRVSFRSERNLLRLFTYK